jgi:anaerobic selenocysteine-containing dehydrogenase
MTPASINRREFLTYSGATVAGVTLGETGRRWLARADERAGAWHAPAVEAFAISVCRECPAACGTRVRLMDRVPVKIDGNPLCPVSRGRLCAKGQAAIEAYFDPDRLVGPARRVGPRKDGRFEPIAWADAIQVLVTQIDKTRGARRGLLAFAAEEHGPFAEAWGQFWTGLGGGAAWTLAADSTRLAPRLGALAGAGGEPIFDVEHATYVLSFGAPVVEDWISPVWTQRSYGRFRRGAARSRGRLVHVEGRRSLTARKSDEWLPVPGDRQASLAYGIASVLLREDRIDRSQLADIGGNLADFERDVVARYTPDNVAATTGVPVVTLLRLARELAATSQPLVVVAADAPPDLIDAVLSLNAIIGAFDRPGGVFQSATARTSGFARVNAASELARLASGGDAPGVVALRDASALRAVSTPGDVASVFEKCDFVVSFSPYLDEAASVADLLLPTHTSLESWHALMPPTMDTTQEVACARPAAEARLDTRGLVELLGAAAAKLGGDAAAGYPWTTDADVVKAELDRLWSLRRGTSYTNVFQTEWVQQLERGGWWVPPAPTREEFGSAVLDAGGWVDPFFLSGGMRQRLGARGGGLKFVPPAAPVDAGAVAGASPHDFPIRLAVFTPAVVNLVGSPNQPGLFELLGQPESSPWRVWAELSPETARKASVEHGSTVRITSAAGSIDALAIVVDRMPPDTIAVAYVPAIVRSGRWAHLLTADVRRLWGRGDPAAPVSVRLAQV